VSEMNWLFLVMPVLSSIRDSSVCFDQVFVRRLNYHRFNDDRFLQKEK
jgi:hypothetical protein